MYNHKGLWDMSKKQRRLEGPGFPWVQVSGRSALPAVLLCFNSKKCVWRATGTVHYLLNSIPTVHCGAAAWCWAAAGTDWSGLKEEGGEGGVLNELLYYSQNPRLGWRITRQWLWTHNAHSGLSLWQRWVNPSKHLWRPENGPIQPDRAERIGGVECKHLHKSRWAKLVSPAKRRL